VKGKPQSCRDLLLGGALLLTLAGGADAASVSWLTDADGNWEDAVNWDSNPNLPGPADDVSIDIGGPAVRTISLNTGDQSVNSLTTIEKIVINGGSLTIGSGGGSASKGLVIGAGRQLTSTGGVFNILGLGFGPGARVIASNAGSIKGIDLFKLHGGDHTADALVSADGSTSKIDFSKVDTITGMSTDNRQLRIGASAGGLVDLSFTQNITSGKLHVAADGAGSKVDLSALQSFTKTGIGSSEIIVSNHGTVDLRASGQVTLTDVAIDLATGGTVNADIIRLQDSGGGTPEGRVSGTGSLNASLTNASGVVAPGHSAGLLAIAGTYSQEAAGTLEIELGGLSPGTGYDQLSVAGFAFLAGTLELHLINGFVPAAGQNFDILSATSVLGTFDAVTLSGFPAGLGFDINYGLNLVTITAVPLPASSLLLLSALMGLLALGRYRHT